MKEKIYTVVCYWNNTIYWAKSFSSYQDAFTLEHSESEKLMKDGATVVAWNNGLTICPLSTTYRIKDYKKTICIIESELS